MTYAVRITWGDGAVTFHDGLSRAVAHRLAEHIVATYAFAQVDIIPEH